MFVMSTREQASDKDLMPLIEQMTRDCSDFSIFDPDHKLVRQDANLRARILEDRYYKVFVEDALQTGHAFLNGNGQLIFKTNEPAASFVGLALEAYVVRCINDSMRNIGRLALQWCSHRYNRPKDSFVDKFFAIGTGLKNTRNNFPFFYSPQSGIDVMFLCSAKKSNISTVTHEPLTIMGTKVAAGIQIKAIQGNEMDEIIKPMLNTSYMNVLTLLRKPDGKHSADVCIDIVQRLAKDGSITDLQRRHLQQGICRPEEIGFDQKEIDHYYDYARASYEGRVQLNSNGCIIDAIAIEVKNRKYNEAGLLLPGSELVI